jgi:hypothetical protein
MDTNKSLVKVEYFAGLDLGQAADYTALAVVERAEFACERDAATWERRRETVLRLRYLERMPLGMGYPEMVDRVREVMESRALSGAARHLVIDGTGVGRPVVDLVREARIMGCRLWPVTITGGSEESCVEGMYRVPKRDLITGFQVLLQTGGFQIASGLAGAAELVREMGEMRVEISGSGHERFGAWRKGSHDDLVLAVSLGLWCARRLGKWWGYGTQPLV